MKKTVSAVIILFIFIAFIYLLSSEKSSGDEVPETEKSITIAAVGDIVMGNTYPYDNLPPEDGKRLFDPAETILSSADIAMGNLECALLDKGALVKNVVEGKSYAFKTPEKYGLNLRNAGFDVLNIANNHIRDFGEKGLLRTREILDSLGIKHTGFLNETAFFKKDSMKVAVMGFSSYPGMNNILCPDVSFQEIRELSDSGYIVIVTFHGGMEGKNACHVFDTVEYMYGELRGNIYRFCRDAVDAGADAVIGHGPHVPRGIELYKGRLIAYSLGNFLTYAGININGINGYAPILEITLNEKGEFETGKIHSFIQVRGEGIKKDVLNSAAILMSELSASDFEANKITIDSLGIITKTIETFKEKK
ncbi:MAG: CapA family protein [bacterium]|nr:CapA family protein [bacterium]